MTKRTVMIEITTLRHGVSGSLFEDAEPQDGEEYKDASQEEADEPIEMLTEGRLITSPSRVELVYEEGELTGMGGSVTSIGFDRNAPGLISMIRTGLVSTAMVFEEGKRHMCLYHTPFSEFEICVRALHVENLLFEEGKIELDYLIEIHGAQAERCKMTVSMRPSVEAELFSDF